MSHLDSSLDEHTLVDMKLLLVFADLQHSSAQLYVLLGSCWSTTPVTSGVAPKTVPVDVGSLYRVSAMHEAATLLAFHAS